MNSIPMPTPSAKRFQKQILDNYFDRLASGRERGQKVVYTFVPGNLTELILSFDLLPVYPEVNALQSALRGDSGDFVKRAEMAGHSEDVCSYVKCDIGMMLLGNTGPAGKPLPPPDLLLLSYTGCFTFMKWFENLAALYDCPMAMLHVPYQAEGAVTPAMTRYVVRQLEEEIIPAMARVSGKPYDPEKIQSMCLLAAQSESLFVRCLESAQHVPSPIDSYFGGVFYMFPIFTAFRGTPEAVEYYRLLFKEIEKRIQENRTAFTLEGDLPEERYRIVVEGPPNWTHFWELWKLFYRRGAVVVAGSYVRVGGIYDHGFRHDPDHPLESFARYCMGCYTNLSVPARVDLLSRFVEDYKADGLVVHSVKSCNSFGAGQLLILKEVEKRTGKPCGFIESDLVDPQYFSRAHIKNRLDAYFQMIDERRIYHDRNPGH